MNPQCFLTRFVASTSREWSVRTAYNEAARASRSMQLPLLHAKVTLKCPPVTPQGAPVHVLVVRIFLMYSFSSGQLPGVRRLAGL